MAEETQEKETQAPVTPVAVELREEVKGQIDSAQTDGKIRQTVVEQLAKVEIDRRVDLLSKALAVRNDVSEQLEKVKPDIVHFDEKGNEASKFFSKAKTDERGKLQKRLGKIDKSYPTIAVIIILCVLAGLRLRSILVRRRK